jgi:hypothetical protein
LCTRMLSPLLAVVTTKQSTCDGFDRGSIDEGLNAVDGAADWGFLAHSVTDGHARQLKA